MRGDEGRYDICADGTSAEWSAAAGGAANQGPKRYSAMSDRNTRRMCSDVAVGATARVLRKQYQPGSMRA